jgi:tetratricopeptide (TPR) repeat protein
MNLKRIEMLQKFIEDDPTDPFNHYALALEYIQHEPVRARDLLLELIRENPTYLPAYYQTATLLIELGQNEEAIPIINQGIEEAKTQNENKTMNELRSLLDEAE